MLARAERPVPYPTSSHNPRYQGKTGIRPSLDFARHEYSLPLKKASLLVPPQVNESLQVKAYINLRIDKNIRFF